MMIYVDFFLNKFFCGVEKSMKVMTYQKVFYRIPGNKSC